MGCTPLRGVKRKFSGWRPVGDRVAMATGRGICGLLLPDAHAIPFIRICAANN